MNLLYILPYTFNHIFHMSLIFLISYIFKGEEEGDEEEDEAEAEGAGGEASPNS